MICTQAALLHHKTIGVSCTQLNIRIQKQKIVTKTKLTFCRHSEDDKLWQKSSPSSFQYFAGATIGSSGGPAPSKLIGTLPCSVCQTVRIITKNVHMHVTRLALSGLRTIDLQMIEAQQLITYDSNPIINYFGPRKSRASYLLIKKMEDSWKNYYVAIIRWD